MGIGESIRNALTSGAFNVIGSSVTITPYTLATSTDSGHSGQVEINQTAVSATAIPFNEFKSIVKQKFGDVETGGTQLALKYSETIDISGSTKYKITYGGDVYDISKIDKAFIKDVVVAYILTLTKRVD